MKDSLRNTPRRRFCFALLVALFASTLLSPSAANLSGLIQRINEGFGSPPHVQHASDRLSNQEEIVSRGGRSARPATKLARGKGSDHVGGAPMPFSDRSLLIRFVGSAERALSYRYVTFSHSQGRAPPILG